MSCPGLYKRITFVTIYSITPDDGPRPLWKSKSGREGEGRGKPVAALLWF